MIAFTNSKNNNMNKQVKPMFRQILNNTIGVIENQCFKSKLTEKQRKVTALSYRKATNCGTSIFEAIKQGYCSKDVEEKAILYWWNDKSGKNKYDFETEKDKEMHQLADLASKLDC